MWVCISVGMYVYIILYYLISCDVMLCYFFIHYIILSYIISSYIMLYYINLYYKIILYYIYICSVYMYKNDSIPMTQGKRPPEYKLMEPKPTQASCFDMHNPTQLFT